MRRVSHRNANCCSGRPQSEGGRLRRDAYETAGGVVMRDRSSMTMAVGSQDPALLDRLVIEKLKAEAETLQAEGWKWIAVAPDIP